MIRAIRSILVAGKHYAPGDAIECDADTAATLIRHNRAEAAPLDTKKAAAVVKTKVKK